MKKLIAFTFALLLLTAASGMAEKYFTYENPEVLIITHPDGDSRVLSSPRASILGACDAREPLYLNGERLDVTENGFFTVWVELDMGENLFSLVNGRYAQDIIITRTEPEPYTAPPVEYFSIRLYGSTEHENTSRFSDFDDEEKSLTPIAKGTTFRITAERGDEFYVIEDGTMVFKTHVYQLDRILPSRYIRGGGVAVSDKAVSVVYEVNEYPLYEISLEEGKAVLTIYADSDESSIEADGVYITDVRKSAAETKITHEFTFAEDIIITGYLVNFTGGVMTVELRRPPKNLNDAVVLLDAGHGGSDPGAPGPPYDAGPMEKDFNLYVAQKTKEYLEALGVNVVFIRPEDEYMHISERTEYFSVKPDIAVCVHANSMPVTSDFTSDAGPLMYVTLEESVQAADAMIRLITEETGNRYEEPKRRNFAMARYTGGPAMLFEMGFLCNPHEYERMLGTQYLDTIGNALGKAIEQYLTGYTGAEGGNPAVAQDEPGFELESEHEPETEAEPESEPETIDEPVQVIAEHNDNTAPIIRYTAFAAGAVLFGAALMIPSVFKK